MERVAAREPDLSFAPVSRAPRTLHADQIDHYNREGWAGPFDVLPPGEVASLRAWFDRASQTMGERAQYGINCYQARCATLWDVANHPRILDLVEDVVGPDIVCWATAFLAKPPGSPKVVPWHQDASFWSLSPARTVTVWLAVDDADEGNAAMKFLPRTHDKGRLATRPAGPGSVFHVEIDEAATGPLPDSVSDDLLAGQCSLHADMLVHGSLGNPSDRRRCGLTLRYCPPEVRITDAAWARGVEAVICRGSDPTGRWTHHPRPANDDPAATASPHVVGAN